MRVQVTESRVFALSDSGRVYVLSAQAATTGQGLTQAGGTPTPSSSRWGSGWLWHDEAGVRHAEIVPAQKLAWGEKSVRISSSFPTLLFTFPIVVS
jgi:hypothetical protein